MATSRSLSAFCLAFALAAPLRAGDIPVSRPAPTTGPPAAPVRIVVPGGGAPGASDHSFNGLKGDRFQGLPAPTGSLPAGGALKRPRVDSAPAPAAPAGAASRGTAADSAAPEGADAPTRQALSQTREHVGRERDALERPATSADGAQRAGARIQDALQGIFRKSPARAAGNGVAPAAAPYAAALARAAATLGLEPETLGRAVAAAERDMGNPYRSVFPPAAFERYLVKDGNFRSRYLDPLRRLPAPAAGEGEWRALVARVADEQDVPPGMLLFWLREERLTHLLQEGADPDRLEAQLFRIAQRRQLALEAATWPRNPQGEFMRQMADQIRTPSGKSIEEISRSGAFAYVTFHGRSVMSAGAGRDPDFTGCDYLLYVTRERGGWQLGYYPGGGSRRPKLPAPEAVEEFQSWLKRGIPHLRLLGWREDHARLPAALPAYALS